MERERVERARRDTLEGEAARLAHEHDLEIGRHLHLAARLARSSAIGHYSAPARLALDAIERRVSAQGPLDLVTPSGVDAIPYLARAHIDGPRSRGPFVVVDCTSTREHSLAFWTDASTSPLTLADRGMLVLLDAAALPHEVQRAIAQSLAEKRAPGGRAEPLDVELAITGCAPTSVLLTAGRMDGTLVMRLGDAQHSPIHLPRLRERAEDLRAIVADRIAREGLRAKGFPVGIDAAAFAGLVDYDFPGESSELDGFVQRLVASSDGDLVQRKDVEALGLSRALPSP
jgi:DNA-binding NtrC family response regulator